MSWEPLGVSRANEAVPAMIATSAGAGRLPPLLQITLRLDQLPVPPFVKVGGTCQVLFGRDADAGLVRIVPGARSRFFALGRRGPGQGANLSIRVKLPAGIKPAKRPPERVEFSHGPDWLELTLPGWGVAVEKIAPAPAGRTSIMDRVPDPAAADRGRR